VNAQRFKKSIKNVSIATAGKTLLVMKQQTLAPAADQGSGYKQYRRCTRREDFLKTMNAIVPWAALCEVIKPH